MQVLTPDTKFLLDASLDKYFNVKNGESLRTVVSNVLHDRRIFTLLAAFLQRGKGLELGQLSLSLTDHIDAKIFYGLTLDMDNAPRKTQLYSYEDITSLAPNNNFRITSGFLNYSRYGSDFKGYPTPKEFLQNVNRVLEKPNIYAVDLLPFINQKR